jgi:hypothetical protein
MNIEIDDCRSFQIKSLKGYEVASAFKLKTKALCARKKCFKVLALSSFGPTSGTRYAGKNATMLFLKVWEDLRITLIIYTLAHCTYLIKQRKVVI